jgi:hypothetical protein
MVRKENNDRQGDSYSEEIHFLPWTANVKAPVVLWKSLVVVWKLSISITQFARIAQ